MRLDRSRPFAEVIGRPGVAYEQDGMNFRPDGEEVVAHVAPLAPAHVEAKPAPVVAHKPRRTALKASTVLAAQFGEDIGLEQFGFVDAPQRDTLASYRDPQHADGSMIIAPAAWVDGA